MNLGTKTGGLAYAERRRGEMVRCFERIVRDVARLLQAGAVEEGTE